MAKPSYDRRCQNLLGAAACLLAISAASGAQTPSAVKCPLRELHFSPDGQYIFAQEDAEITVLTAHPLAILFRISAHDVRDAQFTPDSQQIVFISAGSHVERWSVAGQARIARQDVPVTACGTERLSPDARYLACVDPEGTLRLLDVGTGTTVLERKHYGLAKLDIVADDDEGRPARTVVLMDPSQARVDFSPDGRFFLAAPALPGDVKGGNGDRNAVAYDLRAGGAIKHWGNLGDLKLIANGSSLDYYAGVQLEYFAFIAPDKLMISLMFWAKDGVVTARLMAFPSGREIARPKVPTGPLFRAADPAYVIVRPFGPPPRRYAFPTYPFPTFRPRNPQTVPVNPKTAAAKISTGQVIISETPALDVYQNFYVTEPSSDEVGLYERGKGLQATIALHQQ